MNISLNFKEFVKYIRRYAIVEGNEKSGKEIALKELTDGLVLFKLGF